MYLLFTLFLLSFIISITIKNEFHITNIIEYKQRRKHSIMNVENELKKDGITVIKPLDTLSVTLIAKFVAEKFMSFFPFSRFRYHDLFAKISHLPMYIATIPEGMSEANYFYKNSTIYFKDGLSMDEMKELAIHEFMHHFQEIKDLKGNLYRLGLCDFTGIKVHGMALNEAAVQLISSKILKKEEDSVKYYGISFSTITPSYYPLLCNLISQMAYVVGEVVLFDSTLYSNDRFKNTFIRLTSESTFHKVEKNFDKILRAEEKIICLTSRIEHEELEEKEIAKISSQIGICKKLIQDTFIETQNKILTSYFNRSLHNLYSVQDIEDFRKKLYCYKDLLGTTNNYTYFNDYYINLMSKLDEIYEFITGETALVPFKRSLWQIVLRKISKLFGKSYNTENSYDLS